jgi:hypothetical protein
MATAGRQTKGDENPGAVSKTVMHQRRYFFFSRFHNSRDNTRPQNGQ